MMAKPYEVDCKLGIVTSLASITVPEHPLTIYPNPTTDVVSISGLNVNTPYTIINT